MVGELNWSIMTAGLWQSNDLLGSKLYHLDIHTALLP
jgi:hypothetical protein